MRSGSALRTLTMFLAIGLLPAAGFAAETGGFYVANKSLRDAMEFIGIGAEKQASFEKSVVGRLPAGAEKAMVQKLVRVHAEKSVPLFLQLVGEKSVNALKARVGNDAMVERVLGSIKDGTYLGVEPGTRYFATFNAQSEEDRSKYLGHSGMKFDPLPDAAITIYYFHPALKRLIGTRFEVHKSGDSFALLLPSFGKGR